MKMKNMLMGIQTFLILLLSLTVYWQGAVYADEEAKYQTRIDSQKTLLDYHDERTEKVIEIAELLKKKNRHIPSVVASNWAGSIQTASELYRIDTEVLMALYHVESRAIHYTREGFITMSLEGAGGIGQIMYDIWYKSCPHSKRRDDLRNGDTNILCSAFILRTYLDENNGNLEHALTAYNGGPSAVRALIRGKDFTDGYAKQVLMRV